MLESVVVSCPYCGEPFESELDLSAGTQEYIEDCYVCCKPIQFIVTVNDYQLENVQTKSLDE